ncbi:MFS transporter [Pseudomonas typographi]|uniref:MFS transporter n=1 Tax=Pseudomonas typographi TaxID=2715964 RepID=A0ABR7Z451_9PSED|nr:MFS transporter [Pseudomonas typographi]MBD1588202.1 MFS transporter [Pseudomonas typographi]MBD1600173.1 MFS transporter [Pseudomonas typographi]
MSTAPIQLPPLGLRRASRALRHPNYRRFFGGQFISVIGSWIHSIALGWLIWRLGVSPWLLGMLAFCNQGPILLFGLFTGAIVDRCDRRKLVLCTQVGLTGLVSLLAVLTLSGYITGELAIVIALGLGLISAFDLPGRQALVVDLIERDDLSNALALNSVIFNGARLIGPALGGALVGWVGEGWCFVLIALAYLPLIVFLLRMQVPQRPPAVRRESLLAEIGEGLKYLRSEPEAARILLLVGLCSLTSVPYFSFLPMLSATVLDGGPAGAGILMSITGIGALAAALRLALVDHLPALKPWPLRAALMLGVAQVALSFSHQFWLSALIAAPIGYAILTQNLASNSLLQQQVPDALRGRLMSFYSMMLIGTVPIGAVICGAMAGHLGLPLTTLIGGLTCAMGALLLAARDRFGPRRPHTPAAPPDSPTEL